METTGHIIDKHTHSVHGDLLKQFEQIMETQFDMGSDTVIKE